jgi:acyl-coenzyme A synthetase/AMP-(fatty) acid ligase
VQVLIGAGGCVTVHSAAVGTALDGSGNPAGSAFVTPDLGELVDGELVLQGRTGDVFAVGGHKVDPREVERIILALPGVADAAVVPWQDEHGRQSCAALVATRQHDEQDIRSHCARVLAPAKVPRRIALVAELPRSCRGKLQREDVERLLAALDRAAAGPRP